MSLPVARRATMLLVPPQSAEQRLLAPTPGTAQATLLNILGDIVHPASTAVPTSAFLAVMTELGYSEPAVRQAIARCAASGWIVKQKSGRSTSWSLTAAGVGVVEDGIAGVERLADPYTDWDGTWRITVVTIPAEQRSSRDRVYRALRWDGFGNPMASVWVSPHPHRYRRTQAVLAELGLGESAVSFVGRPDELGLTATQIVERSWDLDELGHHYDTLVERFSSWTPATDAEHLVALLDLDRELQDLLVTDPHLPRALIPRWSGRESAATLLRLRRLWHPRAETHWHDTLEQHI